MSSDERKWINNIRKLAEANPEQVVILKQPEENGGAIYAKFPQKWIKVRPPRKVDLTDEQRAIIAARFADAKEKAQQQKEE